ncbi:MAG TPA: hypothetical protein VFG04_26660 [Planctomycetaceae bacterium]|nr:hypothetical protein [Planctomycetaceae bacterium]
MLRAALQRFVERYLGLPPAQAGERTDWRFEFSGLANDWLTTAAVVVGGAFVVYLLYAYRRDAGRGSRRMQALLPGLRLAVIGLAALCLFQLTLSVGRIGLPVIALVIDDSASMGLEDRYPDDRTNELVDQLAKGAGPNAKTRLGLTQSILTGRDGQFLRELLEHHKLRLYRFSDTATRLGTRDFAGAGDAAEMAAKIKELKAEGSRTRPGPALRKVLEDFRGSPPAAIILFSDGVSSTGDADRLSPAAEAAAASFVPVETVGVGSEQPSRDLQLYDVSAEDLAFVGDPYTISGKVKGEGLGATTVPIRLTERDSGRVLAQGSVNLAIDGTPAPFELAYVPSEPGELDVAIEVPPLPAETNRDNNRETRHVSIRKEKIRVLMADSSPRWEFRYLKSLFERDPTVSLKTVLQEADAEYASEDQTALPHFPLNKDELYRYDILILGDLNPVLLGNSSMELVRGFVRDSGGGVLMIAGAEFNPAAYRGTPWEELVPLDFADAQPPADETTLAEGFHPELTVDGLRGTSIFRMADTESATLEIWKQLPSLHWVAGTGRAKPSARVFAVWHRGPSTTNDVPIVVMQPVGAGKVLFHATDEFWRWRFRVGDLYFGPFWSRAVRYLSRSRLLGRDRTAELTTDRSLYSQGESPALRVRFFDERFVPTAASAVSVTVERRNGERRTVALNRSPGHPTIFEGTATSLPLGVYHAWVASPSFRDAPPAVDFRIETASDELLRRNLDRHELEQTAQITHGDFLTLADASSLPSRIPPGHPIPLSTRERIPLWNHWEVLLLFAGLLTAEWVLRRRARLL